MRPRPRPQPQAEVSLRLRAPAKVNWSLEVLGRRPDGYHEVCTVLQTIELSDWVTLTPADDLSLTLSGEAGPLAGEPAETNLAFRAAARLRRETSSSPVETLSRMLRERAGRAGGARIALEKRVPVAAGLGGGSSDAAAVLRGLGVLWRLPISDSDLSALAAELGVDAPFFLRGGASLASGRGDLLVPLPEGPRQRLVLAWPERAGPADKTARMYSALRPQHHTDGSRTRRLAARRGASRPVTDDDLSNVFEEVLPHVDATAARAFEEAGALGFGRPHLAGSGPALFFLLAPEQQAEPLLQALGRLDLRAVETRTLPAVEALACREEP